jgi:hypothetical protein
VTTSAGGGVNSSGSCPPWGARVNDLFGAGTHFSPSLYWRPLPVLRRSPSLAGRAGKTALIADPVVVVAVKWLKVKCS